MWPIRREFRSSQGKRDKGVEAAAGLADDAERAPGRTAHTVRLCGRTVRVAEAITAGVLICAAGFLISVRGAVAAETARTPKAAHELKRTAQADPDALIQESEDLRRQMRSLRGREPPAWLRADPPVAQPRMPMTSKPEEPDVTTKAPPPGSSEQRLLQRAAALIESRDIAGARLVLEKAYAEGSSLAAYRLAQTYDPDMLRAWGIIGIRGDPARARELYAIAGAARPGERGTSVSR
jgi:hypothetical protein